MSDKLSFSIEPSVPYDPNSGYVYTKWPRPNEAFIANSTSKVLDTGVTINVPSGVTVQVRGLFENEAKNIKVTPMDIHGPVQDYRLQLAIWNMGNATAHLTAEKPMASIRAISTPKARLWHDTQAADDDQAA
jgi:hypothetical protein